jgi:16S rRNA processing protein RimM
VELLSNRPERLDPGSVLSSRTGELRVISVRPHQRRWLVFFDGVVDHEGAERLRGAVLSAEALDEPGTLWVHELVGASVVTTDGRACGDVVGVQANPASDLLELDGGALVPLTFVVERSAGRIVIDPPPGLLDDEG